MAPKRSRAAKESVKAEKAQSLEATQQEAEQEDAGKEKSSQHQPPAKKRKKDASNDESQKGARKSGRGAAKTAPSSQQLLTFMLSPEAEELCRPEEESEDVKDRGEVKTYSGSVMNPFEELLCAVVLSRPISHRLGLRTIRTIFNDPYNFNSAKAVQNAGHDKHLQATWDARTQHKDKTATQIGQVADVVLQEFTSSDDKNGTQLQKALDDAGGDVDKALDALQHSINGLGATGIKIFLRRVQWLWEAGYPYVDDRTQNALRKLGLPEEGEDLQKLVDKHWKSLSTAKINGQGEAQKQRRAFVTVLERAIGADLESKVDHLLQAAGKV